MLNKARYVYRREKMIFQWIYLRANARCCFCFQKTFYIKAFQFFYNYTPPLFCRNSHFTLVSDSTWLDFLDKAIDHNLAKLSTILQEQGETNT